MTESLIFAGTPANAAATLEYLVGHGFEISLVITRPDALVGRKRVLTPSPVAISATKLGLEVYKTDKIDNAAIAKIDETQCSTAVVVAYGALLKRPLWQLSRMAGSTFTTACFQNGAAPHQFSTRYSPETKPLA